MQFIYPFFTRAASPAENPDQSCFCQRLPPNRNALERFSYTSIGGKVHCGSLSDFELLEHPIFVLDPAANFQRLILNRHWCHYRSTRRTHQNSMSSDYWVEESSGMPQGIGIMVGALRSFTLYLFRDKIIPYRLRRSAEVEFRF